MRVHRDLAAVTLAALLCAAVVLLVSAEGPRIAAALPLALLLPGYAITAAAFGRWPLPAIEYLLLSIALSLATLALGALVLDLVPGGLNETSWAVLLLAVVLGACIIASARRESPRPVDRARFRPRLRLADAALLLAAILAVGAAMGLSRTTLSAEDAIGYTQLWMLPKGTVPVVHVGITSKEQETTAYRLEVHPRDPYRIVYQRRFTLRPGGEWVFRFRVPRPPPSSSVQVVARLFRKGDDIAYRRVTGWVSGE